METHFPLGLRTQVITSVIRRDFTFTSAVKKAADLNGWVIDNQVDDNVAHLFFMMGFRIGLTLKQIKRILISIEERFST